MKVVHMRTQRGMAGLLAAGLIAGALVLIALQNTVKLSMDAYHAPNKVSIEVSSQLTQAGLRFVNYAIQQPNQIQAWIDQYKNDPAIDLVCQKNQALPATLTPSKQIYALNTPSSNQEILIKGVFAPYDCNLPLSSSNYRATFETVGTVICNSGNTEQSDSCVTRSVVQTAYEGNIYRPTIETIVAATKTYSCPSGPFYAPPKGSEEEAGLAAACAAVGINYYTEFFVATVPVEGPILGMNDLSTTTTQDVTQTGSTGTKEKKQSVGN